MDRNTSKSITPEAVAGAFKPMEASDFTQAMCEVVGKCADRPLSAYADAIQLASHCVNVHFGLDAAKVGVPLITLLVWAIQTTDVLQGESDEEDARNLVNHVKESVRGFFASIGNGEYTLPPRDGKGDRGTEGERLWDFIAGQAIAVLRGEFDDKDLGEDEPTNEDGIPEFLAALGMREPSGPAH